jgi:hypothetical protein
MSYLVAVHLTLVGPEFSLFNGILPKCSIRTRIKLQSLILLLRRPQVKEFIINALHNMIHTF